MYRISKSTPGYWQFRNLPVLIRVRSLTIHTKWTQNACSSLNDQWAGVIDTPVTYIDDIYICIYIHRYIYIYIYSCKRCLYTYIHIYTYIHVLPIIDDSLNGAVGDTVRWLLHHAMNRSIFIPRERSDARVWMAGVKRSEGVNSGSEAKAWMAGAKRSEVVNGRGEARRGHGWQGRSEARAWMAASRSIFMKSERSEAKQSEAMAWMAGVSLWRVSEASVASTTFKHI